MACVNVDPKVIHILLDSSKKPIKEFQDIKPSMWRGKTSLQDVLIYLYEIGHARAKWTPRMYWRKARPNIGASGSDQDPGADAEIQARRLNYWARTLKSGRVHIFGRARAHSGGGRVRRRWARTPT